MKDTRNKGIGEGVMECDTHLKRIGQPSDTPCNCVNVRYEAVCFVISVELHGVLCPDTTQKDQGVRSKRQFKLRSFPGATLFQQIHDLGVLPMPGNLHRTHAILSRRVRVGAAFQ